MNTSIHSSNNSINILNVPGGQNETAKTKNEKGSGIKINAGEYGQGQSNLDQPFEDHDFSSRKAAKPFLKTELGIYQDLMSRKG